MEYSKPKTVVAMHDLCEYGRASLTAQQPFLAALIIRVCSSSVIFLSYHLRFSLTPSFQNFHKGTKPSLSHWKRDEAFFVVSSPALPRVFKGIGNTLLGAVLDNLTSARAFMDNVSCAMMYLYRLKLAADYAVKIGLQATLLFVKGIQNAEIHTMDGDRR